MTTRELIAIFTICLFVIFKSDEIFGNPEQLPPRKNRKRYDILGKSNRKR